MTIVLFVIGFVILIKGADLLVKGASAIASHYGISQMVIGLTIVSFGTSMPELFVSLLASIDGNTELAVGNVLGSNIANILLILGLSAIIFPLPIRNNTVLSEIPFSIIAVLSIGFFVNSMLPFESTPNQLSRVEGAILLFFFILFMVYVFYIARTGMELEETNSAKPESTNFYKAAGLILLGCVALFLGGKWIVDGAIYIAEYFDLSQSLIGLTIVGVGTSLPELATSAVAAYKKNTDIAVGNVVGSNIFNILWILGLSSVIKPLDFIPANNADILMVLIASSLLIVALAIGKRNHIDRFNGVFFILIYAAYVVYLVYNQG
ncbi:MAG: calcium/sodium antiporter [Crocinitomicaceae bacterium]|nr:calcium/sodium antiporter [Crocinitomicaceae bacterium]